MVSEDLYLGLLENAGPIGIVAVAIILVFLFSIVRLNSDNGKNNAHTLQQFMSMVKDQPEQLKTIVRDFLEANKESQIRYQEQVKELFDSQKELTKEVQETVRDNTRALSELTSKINQISPVRSI